MAARYWVGGNGTWDGTAGTKWATTSGGAGGAAVPTASDDVFLDNGAGTGNVTISGARVCQSINCTGYVNTLSLGGTLTVSGNVTFVAGMTLTGSSTLSITQNSTMTSNGKTIPFPVALAPGTAGGCTYTLADDWTCTSTVTIGNSNSTGSGCIVNGNKFYCTNLTSTAASSRTVSGTTEFVMNSTGTLDGTINFQNNLTINTAGTITMGSLVWGGNTFKRTAGTVNVTSGTTLTLTSLGGTLDLTNVTLYNLTHTGGGSPTYTLVSDITVSNLYTTSAGAPIWNTSTGKKLYVASVSANASTNVTGTATIEFYATGTWSSAGTNARIQNNVIFNASGGTTTISGNIYYLTGAITYTSGTMVTTGSTLNLSGSATLDTNGMSWGNITYTGSNPTLTLSSLLTATGTLTTTGVAGSMTFAGSAGFTVGGWVQTTAGITITLVAAKTYTVTTTYTMGGTNASRVVLKSSSGGSQAIFTLQNNPTTTQDVYYVNATDIDSSLGQTVWEFVGSVSNTLNWQFLTGNSATYANTFTI